jgi:hypothetical protein
MGKGDSVRVRGADRVADTLHGFADALADLDAAAAESAGVVVKAAQSYARRKTGAMAASITPQVTAAGATVTAGVGIARPYPAVQEYGSRRRHITANRYMGRAAETQERPVIKIYDAAIVKAAGKVEGA